MKSLPQARLQYRVRESHVESDLLTEPKTVNFPDCVAASCFASGSCCGGSLGILRSLRFLQRETSHGVECAAPLFGPACDHCEYFRLKMSIANSVGRRIWSTVLIRRRGAVFNEHVPSKASLSNANGKHDFVDIENSRRCPILTQLCLVDSQTDIEDRSIDRRTGL